MSASMPASQSSQAIPAHVAIIMDGNGRWAEADGRSRIEGHVEGARAVRNTVRAASKQGVKYLTLYAFSIANWGRPAPEVQALMALLLDFAEKEKAELHKQNVRVQVVGDISKLPAATREAVQRTMAFTESCTGLTLSLALSYGGRADIAQAARKLAEQVKAGTLAAEDISEQLLQREMSTCTLPPVDLLIRTGGEQRMSDFMLWEAAYAELYFIPSMWPDFGPEQLSEAIAYFAARQRRFGLTGEQVTKSSPASARANDKSAARTAELRVADMQPASAPSE